MPIDEAGIYGAMFHYALVFFLVGSAFLVFLYLWKRNRLDMDEGPKFQMMQSDDQRENSNEHS